MKPSLYEIPRRKRMLLGLGASALLSTLVIAVCFSFQPINVLEWRIADIWARQSNGKTISADVAVVGIDEAFLNEYGWPLERDIYGDAIDYLNEMGAKVLAFDILFADNLDGCGNADSIFRTIVGLTPTVVLGCGAQFEDDKAAKPAGRAVPIPAQFALKGVPPWGLPIAGAIIPYKGLLEKLSGIGFFNQARPFADGLDRRMPLLAIEDTLVIPSLSLASVMRMPGGEMPLVSPEKLTVTVRGKTVAVDRDSYLYVNFLDSIPVYSMSDLRASHRDWLLGKEPKIGSGQLGGRMVFIGNTALSLGDFGITPLSAREPLGRSPNILMHARAASTLLDGSGLHYYGRVWSLLFSVLVAGVTALLFYYLPAQAAFFCALVLCGGALIAGRALYLSGHFLPMLEGTCNGFLFCILGSIAVYFEKELKRKYLYSMFGRYLSPHIIENMYKNELTPTLGGEDVHGSAFFSDIESFSSFSEEMPPTVLVRSLNEYFEKMTRVLLDCNGTLDKYIGDAIVAFFGAPCATSTHAFDACRAAVRMQEALAELRKAWSINEHIPEKLKNIKMRIGINTGRFVTGNIGCEMRMNYTMIGDVVNIAARLEGAGKEYGVYTLVGEDTCAAVKSDFLFRKLDQIRVKGRVAPLAVYQLMGMPREKDDKTVALIQSYETALEAYTNYRFAEAAALFEKTAAMERYPGEKNPSLVLLARCRNLERHLPGHWDGVYTFTNK